MNRPDTIILNFDDTIENLKKFSHRQSYIFHILTNARTRARARAHTHTHTHTRTHTQAPGRTSSTQECHLAQERTTRQRWRGPRCTSSEAMGATSSAVPFITIFTSLRLLLTSKRKMLSRSSGPTRSLKEARKWLRNRPLLKREPWLGVR